MEPAGDRDSSDVNTELLTPDKIGRRIFTDGMYQGHQQGALSYILAVTSLLLYLSWIHVLTALLVASFWYRWALVLLVLIWSTVLLPPEPLLWSRFLSNRMFRWWREYFTFSYVVDQWLDLDQHYIYAEMPHGAFPLSPFLGASLGPMVFPSHKIYSVAASNLFNIPLWRHVMAWIGARPATHEEFRKLMKMGSVAVIPGGIAEMFHLSRHQDVVKLKDRKGFVRMAVEHGVPILPVYHFGQTQVLGWGPKSWEKAARRYRVSLGFMQGRLGLPLPHKVPLMMAIGGPVQVQQMDRSHPDFEATVNESHARVLRATQELYDKYKGIYGWEHHPLVIT